MTEARREAKRRERHSLLGDDPDSGDYDASFVLDMRQAEVLHRGVTLTWLHYVFKRDRHTAKQLLINCPILRSEKNGRDVYYDVAEAAQYLVKPKFEIEKLLGTMKEADLPPELQDKIWAAKLKRQRWQEKAGELWHTQDVLDVLAHVFKGLRTTLQLWPDEIAETTELTDAQRVILTEKIDKLQASLHAQLVKTAKGRQTRAQIASKNDLAEDADAV